MNQPAAIDHDFLDSVQAEIAATLAKINALDAPADEPIAHQGEPWRDALGTLSTHLNGWQGRLEELGAQTAAIEAELGGEEQSLRTWFTALGIASERWARLNA
jgi:hypothetical protein